MTEAATGAGGAAEALAQQLADPEQAARLRSAEAWWPQSLARGAVAVALLHIERARGGGSSWHAAHAWLALAVRGGIRTAAPTGLFEGGPAVAFALAAAADTPDKYRRALHTLDGYLTDLTRRRLRAAHARITAGELATITEYDLIYGLSGIGALLLRRERHHPLLREVLDYLVALTRPVRIAGQRRPGWWTPAAPTGRSSPDFPAGHANLGMAHGIAGPLALLALAARRGITVPGQSEAIATICGWLDEWRQEGPAGPWWPEWITDIDLLDHRPHRPGPHRPSWCYGTPGLARAQQLAGQALGDPARQRLAEHALASCLADPAQLSQLADATICHGIAGAYHTTWRAARDATAPELAAHLPRLRNLLAAAVGDSAAGTADPAVSVPSATADLGLLTGAAGLALASHTAATDAPPFSGWDSCLLIA